MSSDVQEIVNIVKEDTDTKKYIVQKYIEVDHLIYYNLYSYLLISLSFYTIETIISTQYKV